MHCISVLPYYSVNFPWFFPGKYKEKKVQKQKCCCSVKGWGQSRQGEVKLSVCPEVALLLCSHRLAAVWCLIVAVGHTGGTPECLKNKWRPICKQKRRRGRKPRDKNGRAEKRLLPKAELWVSGPVSNVPLAYAGCAQLGHWSPEAPWKRNSVERKKQRDAR